MHSDTSGMHIGDVLDRDDEIEQLVEEGMDRGDAAALADARAGRIPDGCNDDDTSLVSADELEQLAHLDEFDDGEPI